jgi:hypothetical protein
VRASGADDAVDGATLVDVRGVAHVVLVDRALDAGSSRATTYRETKDGWTTPDAIPSFAVDRDARVDVVGGTRLCVSAPDQGRLRVRCLDGSRWRDAGSPVFTLGPDDINTGVLRGPGGDLVVLRNRRLRPTGRFETTAWRLAGTGGWRSVGGDVAPSYPGGSQRPYGIRNARELCVAYNGMRADLTYGPDIALSCLRAGRWRLIHRLAPQPKGPDKGIRVVSGAAADGDGVRVGVHTMGVVEGSWDVYAGDRARWSRPIHSAPGPGWSAQGELFTIRGETWAIRFDQASRGPNLSDLGTRLVVLRNRGGTLAQVGAPLRDAARFSGPLYYGLVESRGRVLALATIPAPGAGSDEIRVFVLNE